MTNRFHVGDAVSFLNEKQDGKVLAIRSDGTIRVEIEEGFTIDVLPSELVLLKKAATDEIKSGSPPEQVSLKRDLTYITRIVEPEQLALLIVPDHERVNNGPVDLFLVNHSKWKLLFSLNNKKGQQVIGMACGIAEPGQSVLMVSIPRQDVNIDGTYTLECLFFRETSNRAEPRYFNDNIELPLPGMVQSTPDLPAPWSFARKMPLRSFNVEETAADYELLKKLAEEFRTPLSKPSEKPALNRKIPKSEPGLGPESEVDLHIEEIKPDTAGMSNTQIIDLQMTHFRKHLDRAILHRQRSIVFIHGIGNGRLRNLIREELSNLGLQYTDAPFNRYGAGATEVLL